ncbi:hypothetical protein D9M71_623530 [compost metagenome]
MAFPGGHGTTQLVGLAGAVVGGDDGDLHHLFLKQRNAKGAFQHLPQLFGGVGFKLFLVSTTQVRMHHAALDRSGANDGHLDHQVIELAGLEPGQHRHLRPGLDLEHADGVCTTDHVVGL